MLVHPTISGKAATDMSGGEAQMQKTNAVMKLCRDLFNSNVIGSDFDDVQAFRVEKRDFPQQPDGKGVHISFSVSWHALGKTGKVAHDALDVLLPSDE